MDPRRSATPFDVLPWEWSSGDRSLTCRYRSPLGEFAERITFPEGDGPSPATEAVFDLLAVACGTSYFKAAPSAELRLHVIAADRAAAAEMARALYDEGLREYALRNGLRVPFTTQIQALGPGRGGHQRNAAAIERRVLVPMGGGRDSAVVATALAGAGPTLFTVGHNPYVVRQASLLGLALIEAGRALDRRLLDANVAGALNGHVPVTAINSLIACATATMTGHDAVAMSNEASADSPTIVVDGVPVNHQFSKSSRFEGLLRAALDEAGAGVDYFSALRAHGELDIARAFARTTGLLPEIMSCNRAFVRDESARSAGWCGRCAKCRFVFLTLAPFVARDVLVGVFGRDLLASLDDLDDTAALLSSDARPFDCVGTPAEARRALRAVARGEWRESQLVAALCEIEAGLPPAADLPDAADVTPAPYRELVARAFS